MMMNVIAFIIIVTYGSDIASFYLLYELASLLVLPVLLTSSRSIRKGYALTSLLHVNLLGLLSFIAVLTTEIATTASAIADHQRWSLLTLLLLTIIAAKTPTYPLTFWLPEAHVECSWTGSIILACFLLKVSSIAAIMFGQLLQASVLLLPYVTAAALSSTWACMSLLAVQDSKRLGALLSILHMNLSMAAIITTSWLLSTTMHDNIIAHSLGALTWFLLVGRVYSSTGSRLLLAGATHTSTSYICCALTLLLLAPLPAGIEASPEASAGAIAAQLYSCVAIATALASIAIPAVITLLTVVRWVTTHDLRDDIVLLSVVTAHLLLATTIWKLCTIYRRGLQAPTRAGACNQQGITVHNVSYLCSWCRCPDCDSNLSLDTYTENIEYRCYYDSQ